MRALTLGLLRNCSGLKGLPYLNTEDFESFAESPAIAGFATAESLRKVEDFFGGGVFFSTLSALFRKTSSTAKARFYWLSAVSSKSSAFTARLML